MEREHASVDLSRARWHKSTHSNGGEGGCIEVADNLPGVVAVRDSKDPDGPALTFKPAAWRRFLRTALKDGQAQH
jgi:uncharacterized protein DUF397